MPVATINPRAQRDSKPRSNSWPQPNSRSQQRSPLRTDAESSRGPTGARGPGQLSHGPVEGRPDNRPEPKILFQSYFKSVGPRTYAAQVKEASNGNHFIVLTEGKPDKATGELRKTRLLVFSEDFESFFKLVDEARQFAQHNPVPDSVKKRQSDYWKHSGKPPARD